MKTRYSPRNVLVALALLLGAPGIAFAQAPSQQRLRDCQPESADSGQERIARLRTAIRTCRDNIEAGRTMELAEAREAYLAAVDSIAPRDMFETEQEYRAREDRERTRASQDRARAERRIHGEYDALVNAHVDPLFEEVHTLLGRADAVFPGNAVELRLDEYDVEREVFVGAIEIDSDLLSTNARLLVPDRRASARELWPDRDSVKAELSLSMDVVSLDLQIDAVWISFPSSGSRRRGFLAQDAFKASARDVAAQAAAGLRRCCSLMGNHARDALAAVRAYNRLLLEAKLVLRADRHIHALRTLPLAASEHVAPQTLQSVITAANGLEAYLTSFRSHEAFATSARDLAGRAERGENACCRIGSAQGDMVNVLLGEYNRLIGEARTAFTTDASVRSLQPLAYLSHYTAGRSEWNSVATAARRLERSFERLGDRPPEVRGSAVQPSSLGHTPLAPSSRFSPDARKLVLLLGRPLSAEAADASGWTDLHYAAALNLDQLASALLDAGADPNAEVRGAPYAADAILRYFGVDLTSVAVPDRITGYVHDASQLSSAQPLHVAAIVNAEAVAARLLSANANIAAQMSEGQTPLHLSAGSASRELVTLLLEEGAAVNAKDREGFSPRHYAQLRCQEGDEPGGLATDALLKRFGGECDGTCQSYIAKSGCVRR